MRITFILPFVHSGGGVRVVFEHTRELEKRGHSVQIIYPGPGGVLSAYQEPERTVRALKYQLDHYRGKKEYNWFHHPLKVKRVPDLRPQHIPSADVVIATSNETADWVVQYPERCGVKAYFIQDYETWSRPQAEVDKTWRYPLARITISQWLYDLGATQFSVPMYGPVVNGIDTSQFYPDPDLPPSQRTQDILMIYRQAPQKGCKRGLEILSSVAKKYPNTKFTFFGRETAPGLLHTLGNYHLDPSPDEIRKLYSSARIFFLPSFQEGFSLTPMEATACGAAVVATKVGGPMDFLEDGVSGRLADPQDDEGLENALLEALGDKAACDSWSNAAKSRLQSYTWERSTAMLEQVLQSILTNART